MHVLVTGGAGYIGSHTCKMLAKAGFQPIVLDDLRRGHRSAVQWGPLIEGDCGDPATLEQAFTTYPIKAVIHFAAYAYVGESLQIPDVYFRNNVVATMSLLDAMKVHGVTTIVFSSSCATYGVPIAVPIAEDHPQAPIKLRLLMVRTSLLQRGWSRSGWGVGRSSRARASSSSANPGSGVGALAVF
jgi:UDP-arabinose 4-epimerase